MVTIATYLALNQYSHDAAFHRPFQNEVKFYAHNNYVAYTFGLCLAIGLKSFLDTNHKEGAKEDL